MAKHRKKLIELCNIQYGYAFDSGEFTEDKKFIPLVRIRDVKRGYSETFYCGEYPKEYVLHAGDLLVGMDGEFNIARWRSRDALLNQRVCKIVAKENTDEEYLRFYLVKALKEIEDKTSFATVKHLSAKELNKLELDIPEYSEQKEMSSALKIVEYIIELRKRELEELDDLIKSRFVELFGDPIHSDKFDYVRVETCVADKNDMVDGPFGSQVDTKVDYIENGEIPVIRTVNVKMMQFSPLDLKFMTREKYNAVIRSQVLPGDVILTKVGTIGNVCIFPEDYDEAVLSTTGSCRIRVDESKMNKVFFAYNLMYLKPRLLEIASAGVQPFLNMKHVKNIEVLNVPMEQQEQFADFVRQVDKSKFEVQKSLKETQVLMDSLMQQYFG